MESGNSRVRVSKLLICNGRFDAPIEVDEKLEGHYNRLMENLKDLSEKDAHDWLNSQNKDPKFVEVSSGGFLYGILTDKPNDTRNFRYMTICVTDNYYTTLYTMNMILLELFNKMRPEAKDQILYFFREAIKSNMPKVDNVLLNLMRTVNDGGSFNENCSFVCRFADLLSENREWIRSLKQGSLAVPMMLLTFSRFLHDCTIAGVKDDTTKRSLETIIDFLLRERLNDMQVLGRELVLILMRLGRHPVFSHYFKSLVYEQLPVLGGLPVIMNKPIQSVIFNYRLSLHLSRKIDFLLKMKMPNFNRHFEWFAKQHLDGPEGVSLRVECIRYLWFTCVSSNDFNHPHIVENRMQFLFYLFKTAKNGVELQTCKLYLLWDWLGFDSNIPNSAQLVEPAFSFIRYLLNNNALALANSLVDFLIRVPSSIVPNHSQFFVQSMLNNFKQLNSLVPIMSVLDNTRLDKPLRDAIRETFPDLFGARQPIPAKQEPPPQSAPSFTPQLAPVLAKEEEKPVVKKAQPPPPIEEDHKEKKKEKKKLKKAPSLTTQAPESKLENVLTVGSFENALQLIKDEFKAPIEELNSAVQSKSEDAPDVMQNLILRIFDNEESLTDDQDDAIAESLLIIYRNYLSKREFFPSSNREDDIADSFTISLYVLFRNLVMNPDGDDTRKLILRILAAMQEKCNCIGYLLLFFIKGSKIEAEEPASAYIGLCKALAAQLEDQLLEDLKQCVIDDHRLFAYLVPFIIEKMPEITGNVDLMRLICGSIDSSQALTIVREMCLENFTMFQKDSLLPIINASLNHWDSIEQMMLWTFIRGFVKFEWLISLIPKLNYQKHPEAITNLLLMIKQAEPSKQLIQSLLSRPANDYLTCIAIKVLIDDQDSLEQVATHISSIIKRLLTSGEIYPPSPTKEKARKNLYLELVFSHLDTFRTNCLTKESRRGELFLSSTQLQDVFATVKKSERASDLRIKYTELFAVMEIFNEAFDENTKQRPIRKTRQTRADVDYSDERVKRRRIKDFEDSDED